MDGNVTALARCCTVHKLIAEDRNKYVNIHRSSDDDILVLKPLFNIKPEICHSVERHMCCFFYDFCVMYSACFVLCFVK